MNNIEWKDGAVCYAFGKQQYSCSNLKNFLTANDFKLKKIRTGDYIPASELDTEQKYNEVVEVFGLFGHESDSQSGYNGLVSGAFSELTIRKSGFSNVKIGYDCKRQLTYSQIIAIGKLKRMMLDKLAKDADDAVDELVNMVTPTYVDVSHHDVVSKLKSYSEAVSDVTTNKPPKRNKSKQAYDILKSLDYEYDLVKQKWFKKVYIND